MWTGCSSRWRPGCRGCSEDDSTAPLSSRPPSKAPFTLAIPRESDTPPIAARRATCADIADGLVAIGFPRTAGDGRAAAPWFQAQIDAWSTSEDPRQRAMADTARRELIELLD